MDGGGRGEGGTGVTDVHLVNGINSSSSSNNNNIDNDNSQHHNATSRSTASNVASTETTRPQNPLKRKSTSSVATLSQSAVDATNFTANAFIGGRNNRAWRSWMVPQNQQENGTASFNPHARPQVRTQTQTRPRPASLPSPAAAALTLRPSPPSEVTPSQPNASTLSTRPIVSPLTTRSVQSPVSSQFVLPTQHFAQQQIPQQPQHSQHLLQQQHPQQQHALEQLPSTVQQQLQQHRQIAQLHQQVQQASIQLQQSQQSQLQEHQVHLRLAMEKRNQLRALEQVLVNHRLSSVQTNSQLQSPMHGNFPPHAQTTQIQIQAQYWNPVQAVHLNQSLTPSPNPRHVRPQSISGSQMRAIPLPGHPHPQPPVGSRPMIPEHRIRSMSDAIQRPTIRPEFHFVLTDTGSSIPGYKIVMDHHLLPAALVPSQKVPEGETLFLATKKYAYLNLNVTPNIFHSCKFEIIDSMKIAGSRPIVPQPGKPPRIRIVEEESLTYRIRFVTIPKILTEPDLSTWGCNETKHPPCAFAEINGQILDFRKKKNWGKDLPTDITDYIQQGPNEVKVAVFEDQAERDASRESIAFCIEILEVTSRTTIHKNCATKQFIPINEAKARIKERIQPRQPNNDDDDLVTVGSDTIVLDLKCPISKTTLKVPVRGKHCSHIDCFDLDSFLSSRPKYAGGVPVPDAWFCPICGTISDCRPQNLVMDGFIKETIRRIIADKGDQHDVDRVVIRSDGLWKIYRPDLEANQTEGKKKHEVIDLLDDD